jgi:hypothetical protein
LDLRCPYCGSGHGYTLDGGMRKCRGCDGVFRPKPKGSVRTKRIVHYV